MGSKLTVLTGGVIVACALVGPVLADAPAKSPGTDDAKKGIELFKAGKYGDAAAAFSKAYAADAKLETLYALAQAERLGGDCVTAAAHYHKVLELQSDLAVAKLVQQNLELCEPAKPEPTITKPVEPPQTPVAPPPTIITKVVTHDVPHTDPLVIALASTGALAIGTGVGLFLAARSDRDSADHAASIAEHDSIADRAGTEKLLGFVVGGAGVALVGGAVFRWFTRDRAARDTHVALSPTVGGGSLTVSTRF